MVQDHLMMISITVSMKLKNRIVSRGICYYITANGRHTFHVSYIIAQLTRECHRVGVDLFVSQLLHNKGIRKLNANPLKKN